ncbi:MAG: 16S rRNA (guanine(966)-N(2))-methyltransferase RsmD, partial [Gammaproteobacteria bacterium]|nr:16S rRNA (guanine(966)-N(2))-methyltransferase RsmD [Gammaproteobacteria bacterium]
MKPSKLKKTEKGKLRIIGGQWRGRKLKVADKPGLRPTPDRLRETLFNWLAPCITGARCLDLFAGSGALGIEAASRGAARVVLLERDADCARNLAQQRELLAARHIQVICGDALQFLKDGAASAGSLEKKRQKAGPDKQAIFDIIFLDPP